MKRTIAIIMGGYSSEVEISLMSGNVVYQQLSKERYTAYKVHILKEKWVAVIDGTEYPINKHDFSFQYQGKHVTFDCVFNAIHGTPGEDGKVQAYFDMLNIPYTSCGQDTSALTFNKHLCNKFISSYGIRVADSITLFKEEQVYKDEIIQTQKHQ